jgi:uncharacterized protein HemY
VPQPTQELQDAIQSLHAAIASEPDPEDKAALGQCLTQMMKVQAKNMAQDQQQGGQQQQGPPDQGAPPDPQQALIAAMQGGQ